MKTVKYMKRQKGADEWEEISPDEALDIIIDSYGDSYSARSLLYNVGGTIFCKFFEIRIVKPKVTTGPTAFEVGKYYNNSTADYDPIKVLKRTEKFVFVTNGGSTWRMRLRQDGSGNEVLIDSSMGKRHSDIFTYRSDWVAESMDPLY